MRPVDSQTSSTIRRHVRLSYSEFEKRFIARMVERGARWVTHGGDHSYGKQAAMASWESPDADHECPEDEADSDMSYWGDS